MTTKYISREPKGSNVGKIVKIKDEAKYFIGMVGIPDWVRNAELYLAYEDDNGTSVIGFADSYTTFQRILTENLIITDKERTFTDTIDLADDIDVRIMGVPSRMDNIKVNQKRLHIPKENIIIDTKHEGCLKTAMRAWSKPTDKPYVMVLQDDIELCDEFADCCNRIVRTHPNKIISLFQWMITRREAVNRLPSPYISLGYGGASGQGIIMPSDWIPDCLAGWETSGILGDDTNINEWAKKTGREIISTVPAILQHIGEHSVFAPGRVLGKCEFYSKSAASVDWENGYVTSITNILR